MLDQVFAAEDFSDGLLWNLQDTQQTVTEVVDLDASGGPTIVNQLDYNVNGELVGQTNDNYQPHQTYTGQILDDVTGLVYYDARWFDPNVNQFISEDPIGFAAGDANLRRYVGNGNPNATDPSGLQEHEVARTQKYDKTEVVFEGGKYYWVGSNYQFGFGFGGYFRQEAYLLKYWDQSTYDAHAASLTGSTSRPAVYAHPLNVWDEAGRLRPHALGYKVYNLEEPQIYAQERRDNMGSAASLVGLMGAHVARKLIEQYGAQVGGKVISVVGRTRAGELAINLGGKPINLAKKWLDDAYDAFCGTRKGKARPSIDEFVDSLDGKTVDDLLAAPRVGATSKLGKRSYQRFVEVPNAPSTLNPGDVRYMQSSIKNTTGDYTVLGNIDALKRGDLLPSQLGSPIKVWKDADGVLWSLDHRRLAAFKEAGIDNVPVVWATRAEVQKQAWKMTTKTDGLTIRIKIGPGESRILGQ